MRLYYLRRALVIAYPSSRIPTLAAAAAALLADQLMTSIGGMDMDRGGRYHVTYGFLKAAMAHISLSLIFPHITYQNQKKGCHMSMFFLLPVVCHHIHSMYEKIINPFVAPSILAVEHQI